MREYVWVGDLPVAVLDGSSTPANPTLLWVHADHLKRPELMTDASKAVVWKAVYEPFGAVSSITGVASNQMRFPGQWYQLEAGLHYNWWRHYDPTLGRYTQPDPLGLGQGPAQNASAGTAPVPNGTPGTSVWATGLSGTVLGRQTGLLAGLSSLQDGRQGPLGLGTDFASAFNPATTSPRDGPSLYGYVRQSPGMRTDYEGLNPALAVVVPVAATCIKYPILCKTIVAGVAAAVTAVCEPLIVAMAKKTGKERGDDIPSDYEGQKPAPGETGKDFADRLLGGRPRDTGPGSDWNRLKKFGDRYPESMRK